MANMKFYIEKGKINEAKISEDEQKEIIFLITITNEQIEKLRSGQIIGFRIPEEYEKDDYLD